MTYFVNTSYCFSSQKHFTDIVITSFIFSNLVKRKQNEVTDEKWKFVTGHTARRSLCTNLYARGLEVEEIMSITGHDSYKECVGYIKIPLRGIEKPIPKDVWNICRI